MITIEVLEAIDSDRIGNVQFFKNLIYIGNGNSDLFVNERGIYQNHLFIEIIEGRLLVHPHEKCEYYLVNRKRTTSFKYININEIVQIGHFKFKITEFIEETLTTDRDIVHIELDELINNNKEAVEILLNFQEQLEEISGNE